MQAFSKLLYAFTLFGITLSVAALPKLQKRLAPACDPSGDVILNPSSVSGTRTTLAPLEAPGLRSAEPHNSSKSRARPGTSASPSPRTPTLRGSTSPTPTRSRAWSRRWVRIWADYAWGKHCWVADPNDPTDGSVNPYWDFASIEYNDVLAYESDQEKTFLIGSRTGTVSDPFNPSQNTEWTSFRALLGPSGQPYGTFASQTFQIFPNGGAGPTSSCTPYSDLATVKTVLNFWYYSGS